MKGSLNYIILFFAMLLMACRSPDRNQEIDEYLGHEIKSRMTEIATRPDSLYISPVRIDREINNLLLMTRDLENIATTTNKANRYFNDLATAHHLDAISFARIDPAMDLDEIASRLKENELSFFNQVIFKNSPSDKIKIYTAH